jgi:hypothetical protein
LINTDGTGWKELHFTIPSTVSRCFRPDGKNSFSPQTETRRNKATQMFLLPIGLNKFYEKTSFNFIFFIVIIFGISAQTKEPNQMMNWKNTMRRI